MMVHSRVIITTPSYKSSGTMLKARGLTGRFSVQSLGKGPKGFVLIASKASRTQESVLTAWLSCQKTAFTAAMMMKTGFSSTSATRTALREWDGKQELKTTEVEGKMKTSKHEINNWWLGATIASIVIGIGGHLFPVFGKPTVIWNVIFGLTTLRFGLATIYFLKEDGN
ncbi:MAG: hypothetical protein HY376_02895 [Candidatus Blackburnbacteria bacterium]|nr:hypothetical protein [Candidatus Blackburnbacteria bacterium]